MNRRPSLPFYAVLLLVARTTVYPPTISRHTQDALRAIARLSSYRKLSRYRINKVTSSAGSARNQMKRVWLFARYGIIGLAVDDVPGVRA